ncbi:hypothetical protein QWZ10_02330 [Paracoccus cavernae]|uniref:Uncharacterized protein n=1 Tax=Paracoccus cavernae TaxID=1571207 RepID=A0ABT8D2A1_9RHOB|nr:hypothetical protein [Paracoccus cavernae]
MTHDRRALGLPSAVAVKERLPLAQADRRGTGAIGASLSPANVSE